MKGKKEKAICLLIIFVLLLFPILSFLFPPHYWTVLEVFVNFDGLTIGDDVPAEGMFYEIKDGTIVVDSGYIGEDGYVRFYPLGVIANDPLGYRLHLNIHDENFMTYLGDGSSSQMRDRSVTPYVIDAELLWEGVETPVISELVELWKHDGTDWHFWASLTTDALGGVEFMVNDGLFSFYPGISDINILQSTMSPIIDQYFIASILSRVLCVIILLSIVAQLYYFYRKLRWENLTFFLIKFKIIGY